MLEVLPFIDEQKKSGIIHSGNVILRYAIEHHNKSLEDRHVSCDYFLGDIWQS